jgi:hypothetical protein
LNHQKQHGQFDKRKQKINLYMKKLFLVLAWTTAQVMACAQGDTLSPDLLDKLKGEQVSMFDMFTRGDVETFKTMAGDDYLTINADGTYMNKTQAYDLIPKFKGSTYKVLEQTDRVYHNVVISTGRAKFYFGPMLAADVYFTQGWIYRDSRWQFIIWQGTMTGTPKNYPVYMTLIGVGLVTGIGWLLYRLFRRKKRSMGKVAG